MQYLVWAMGGLAAYLLWGQVTWLAVVVIIAALSYSVHGDEQREYELKGEYSTGTATRLFLTFMFVAGVLLYGFLV